MILEVADLRIPPGRQAEFDEAIVRGVTTVIAQARGFLGGRSTRASRARSATC